MKTNLIKYFSVLEVNTTYQTCNLSKQKKQNIYIIVVNIYTVPMNKTVIPIGTTLAI